MKKMTIRIENLSKDYKNVHALNKIDLDIKDGVFGLLGQNGAGKTTLMRILTTLIKPTDGSVHINNIPIEKKYYTEIKRMIGYLPQDFGIYPNMNVREVLDYMGIMNEMPSTLRKQRVEQMIEWMNLTQHSNKKISQLSGGMKRRVGLAQAMLSHPQVLIVDEPTTGLDPEERIRIRNLLSSFAKDRIVLLSTHIVEDIAAISNNLAVLNKGEINFKGTVEELICEVKGKVYTFIAKKDEQLISLRENYQITSTTYIAEGINCRLISDEKPNLQCTLVEPTIEDAFIYATRKRSCHM